MKTGVFFGELYGEFNDETYNVFCLRKQQQTMKPSDFMAVCIWATMQNETEKSNFIFDVILVSNQQQNHETYMMTIYARWMNEWMNETGQMGKRTQNQTF